MQSIAEVILANRAYCDHETPPEAEPAIAASHGGLLAALRPAIAPWDGKRGTTWVGAGRGACDQAYTDEHGFELIETPQGPLRHRRLYFNDDAWEGHYAETANSFLWPLVHLVRVPLPELRSYYPYPQTPSPEAWRNHELVNATFADAAAALHPERTCWVHDYQLGLVPGLLRERGVRAAIGFFLHTPFPSVEIVGRLLDETGRGYLRQFVAGILGADLAGFQCASDQQRFMEAATDLGLAKMVGDELRAGGRVVRTGVFPVGIDPEEVLAAAKTAPIPAAVEKQLRRDLPLVIGLERADFTKGIPERLAAVARLYRENVPFAYVGVAAPTRDGVPAYAGLAPAISQGVDACTAAAKAAGGQFLHLEESLSWDEVVALQREADVVFTSSLADGMNLVPLQAAIAQSIRPPEKRAVIIAGRDAGVTQTYAGYEKDGLVAVDPLDNEEMTMTLRAALAGRPGRISDRLIASVCDNDARKWAERFLTELEVARADAGSH